MTEMVKIIGLKLFKNCHFYIEFKSNTKIYYKQKKT